MPLTLCMSALSLEISFMGGSPSIALLRLDGSQPGQASCLTVKNTVGGLSTLQESKNCVSYDSFLMCKICLGLIFFWKSGMEKALLPQSGEKEFKNLSVGGKGAGGEKQKREVF